MKNENRKTAQKDYVSYGKNWAEEVLPYQLFSMLMNIVATYDITSQPR